MSCKQDSQTANQSNNSDDDWTLVPPPQNSSTESSGEEVEGATIEVAQEVREEEATPAVMNDGLDEIDLNSEARGDNGSGRSSSTDDSIPTGFRALDSTSSEESGSGASRRSSISSTLEEFPDFVRLNKEEDDHQSPIVLIDEVASTSVRTVAISSSSERKRVSLFLPDDNFQLKKLKLAQNEDDDCEEEDETYSRQAESRLFATGVCPKSIQSKFDELSSHFALPQSTRSSASFAWWSWVKAIPGGISCLFYTWILLLCFRVMLFPDNSILKDKHRVELMNIHKELGECIQRQSPSSFRHYIQSSQDARFVDDLSRAIDERPQRGLVCYGQESKWRKRFDQLKSDHDLDLAKLQRVAKDLSSSSKLDFTLILNQLKYLDYLEDRRKRVTYERTIEHLKAENRKLVKKLNEADSINDIQRSIANLESEISKLRNENEGLRANLKEKAGPVYIKQAIEKEQVELENKMLKKFLFDINKAVSWNLKKFNIHTVDASLELDNLDVLDSQVSITKGYLYRLTDRVAKLIDDNESLKDQLKETHLQLRDVDGLMDAAMPLVKNHDDNNDNRSRALVFDNCMRNLLEMRMKADHLEGEVVRMRRDCNDKNVGLERGPDRNLNRTRFGQLLDGQLSNWKQLSRLAETTSMGKRMDDSPGKLSSPASIIGQDIVDELMAFLTKFNHHMEQSKSLALLGRDFESQATFIGPENSPKSGEKTRVLPNYIQEAIRVPKVKIASNEDSNLPIRLPPTPPQTAYFLNPSSKTTMKLSPTSLSIAPSNSTGQNAVKFDWKSLSSLPEKPPAKQPANQTTDDNENDPAVRFDHLRGKPVFPSDSWFFKRAKQRKELRHIEPNPNWAIMRAKLREKLRTASAYIENNYLAKNYLRANPKSFTSTYSSSSRKGKHCKHSNSDYTNNYNSKNDKKTKRLNRRDKFRDEL